MNLMEGYKRTLISLYRQIKQKIYKGNNMNWKEFKEYVESEGVTDDMFIGRIYLMEDRIPKNPPIVKILKLGINEIVIIK